MDTIINVGIPHIGEQIFQSLEIVDLIRYKSVSETWKGLIENVLCKKVVEKYKSDVNAVFEQNDQALVTTIFKILLEGSGEDTNIDFNVRNQFGRTPFIQACVLGNKTVVKLLMDHSIGKNVDLNAQVDPPSGTLTLYALNRGWTGLFFACHYGHSDVVKLMLEYSSKVAIDFNVRSRIGFTPFMEACKEGHSQTVQLLLENSRDLNIDVNIPTSI